jgi:hypothetical protein
LIFDDSITKELKSNNLINHNEISKPNQDTPETNWWDRLKRSVKSFFGYAETNADSQGDLSLPVPTSDQDMKLEKIEIIPTQLENETVKAKEMLRQKREHLNDDDEEDDDEDNEIGGSGDQASEKNWDNTTPDPEDDEEILPNVQDSKFCKRLFCNLNF